MRSGLSYKEATKCLETPEVICRSTPEVEGNLATLRQDVMPSRNVIVGCLSAGRCLTPWLS